MTSEPVFESGTMAGLIDEKRRHSGIWTNFKIYLMKSRLYWSREAYLSARSQVCGARQCLAECLADADPWTSSRLPAAARANTPAAPALPALLLIVPAAGPRSRWVVPLPWYPPMYPTPVPTLLYTADATLPVHGAQRVTVVLRPSKEILGVQEHRGHADTPDTVLRSALRPAPWRL